MASVLSHLNGRPDLAQMYARMSVVLARSGIV
jgi:hypothetical protein